MSSAVNNALYARLTGTEVLSGDFLALQKALFARLAFDPKKQKPAARYGNLADYALFPCVTYRPAAGLPDRRFSVDAAVDNGVYDVEVWGQSREANEVTDIAELVDGLLLSRLGAPPLPTPGRIYSFQTFVTLAVMYDAKRNAWFGLTRYKIVERLR